MLGHGFWQRWFGGDPTVLGRQLTLPDGSLTIIGVGPAGFRIGQTSPKSLRLWESIRQTRRPPDRARFRPMADWRRGRPSRPHRPRCPGSRRRSGNRSEWLKGWTSSSSAFGIFSCDARPSLQLLMAVVAIVLSYGCVNLAGLLAGPRGSLGASSPCARHSGRVAAAWFDSWSSRASCSRRAALRVSSSLTGRSRPSWRSQPVR